MLKIRIISLLFLFSLVTEASFDDMMKSTKKSRAEVLKAKVGKLYKLRDIKKYGFVDKTGKWIISPKFVAVSDFDEYGYAIATMTGRVDKKLAELYRVMGLDMQSLSTIASKFGFINVKGEWVIEPEYDKLYEFKGNEAEAELKDKKGFIDREGNWYKQSKKTKIDKVERYELKHTSSGMGYLDDEIEKYGIYDNHLKKWKVQPNIELQDGRGLWAKKDGKWGLMDEDGSWKIQPKFLKPVYFDEDGLGRAQHIDSKWGLIDHDGEWVLKPNFVYLGSLEPNGLRAAREPNKKIGYIDDSGEYYISPSFDKIMQFQGNHAEVTREGKSGVIDRRGKVVISIKYDSCNIDNGQTYIVTIGEKKGLIDQKENWIIKPLFDNINVIDEHMIKVEYGNYEGYTDITGKPLTFTMDEVENVINMK